MKAGVLALQGDFREHARVLALAGATPREVRTPEDLESVRAWLSGDRACPLVVDAKVTSKRGSWWLEEAFRGH
jgi:hypothetical protein